MKHFNYIVAAIVAILMSFVSYGIFSLFGFTNFPTFWLKLGFYGVLLLQLFVPIALLTILYEQFLKAERESLDEARASAPAPAPVRTAIERKFLNYPTLTDFPTFGEAGHLYRAQDSGTVYMWESVLKKYVVVS